MKIKVRLNGILSSQFGWREREIELPSETTIAGLKKHLEDLESAVSFESIRANSSVNRQVVFDDVILQDGDEVALLPPLAGG